MGMIYDPIVLGNGYVLPGTDIGTERINDNVIAEAPSGSGKTTGIVFPTIARMENMNLIAEYAKEEEAIQHGSILRQKGYAIDYLNVRAPERSTVSFDPIKYIENFTDVEALSDMVVHSTLEDPKDPYWTMKSKPLHNSLCISTMAYKKNAGMVHVLRAFEDTLPVEGECAGFSVRMDGRMAEIRKAAPHSLAVREYDAWRSLPFRTASCVRDTLAAALSNVFPESIRNLMKTKPEIDFEKNSKKRHALFIISDASEPGQSYYTNLFWSTAIRQLRRIADRSTDHHLTRPVRLVFGDFGCTSPIRNFEREISVFRSAGISCLIILQSQSQLESVYGPDKSVIIRQNCPVQVYLSGGMDEKSCSLVSRRMNLPIEDVMYAKIGKVFIMQAGRKPVIVDRYDTFNSREYKDYLEMLNRERSGQESFE